MSVCVMTYVYCRIGLFKCIFSFWFLCLNQVLVYHFIYSCGLVLNWIELIIFLYMFQHLV